MSDMKFGSWEDALLRILDEKDPEKFAQLVAEAELAMFKRELELKKSPQNSEELSTMCIAAEALRIIKCRITKSRVLESAQGNAARFGDFVRRAGAA